MILDRTDFRDVYVQPAAHDAGTSIGAVLDVQHQELKIPVLLKCDMFTTAHRIPTMRFFLN